TSARVGREYAPRETPRLRMLADADADHGLLGHEVEGALDGVEVHAAIDREQLGLLHLADGTRIPRRVGQLERRAARAVRQHLRGHEVVRGPELRSVPDARAARTA